MFNIKHKQGNARRRVIVALILVCLMVYTADLQLYIEQRILDNAATRIYKLDKFNQKQNYFNMSLPELMEVVVVETPDERLSSYLLDFSFYHFDSPPETI
jgi:hypothetical protein